MSGPADPKWMPAAEALFAGCLWLFPKPLREAHGEEMRQAFRDRCREVARGERSAFRVLVLELLPDTLRSAGSEQFSATFDDMRPRQFWALGLLCCAATGLLFHDSLSHYTLDLAFKVKYGLRNLRDAREMAQREEQVRRLAEHLKASDSLESKALAAYLYRSLYTGRDNQYAYGDDRGGSPFIGRLPADGDRATAVAASVFAAHPDAYPLIVAVQACEFAVLGCDRAAAIRRLTEREPDNGFGWSLAFKWASQHGDQLAMRDALGRMAQSLYFENHQGRITRDLLNGAQKLAPGDLDVLAVIALQARHTSYLVNDDFKHDVRNACTARPAGDSRYGSRWLEANPDSQGDCLRIAGLLSRSTDLIGQRWGWRRIHAQETDTNLRAKAYQHLRDNKWWLQASFAIGMTHRADGSWSDWSAADWQQWSTAWNPGDGEIPAMKRWLAARGQSVSAPAEFEIQLR